MKKMLIIVAVVGSFALLSGCGCGTFSCTTSCPCEYTSTCCGSNGWY
ncbi:hypothetical protein [Legionella feeleii]|nr:hypothetical protein [Legionella feeleii]